MVLHYYSQHYLTFSSAVVKEKIILATLDRKLRIMSIEFHLVVWEVVQNILIYQTGPWIFPLINFASCLHEYYIDIK